MKAKLAVLFVCLSGVLFLSYLFLLPKAEERLLEGNIETQLEQAIEKEGSYRLSLGEGGHCYWLRPTHDGENYLVEIAEINSTKDCLGDIVSKKTITSQSPISYDGGCLCGKGCSVETEKDEEGIVNLKVFSCEKK